MHAKKYLVSFIAVVGFFMLSEIAYPAGVVSLPRTGQIACYDGDGKFISCTDTGQDGNIQAGAVWPAPRFIDHEDGTVTDSLTGLIWTKNANPSASGLPMSWQAALDFVKTITTGGHSDWRLPNERELRSLADYSKYNPALPQDYSFTNVRSDYYWSSTSSADHTSYAWAVDMGSGHGYNNTTYSYDGWPARSGQCGSFDNSTTTTTVGTTSTAFSTSTVQITTTSVISSTITTAVGVSSTTITSAGAATTTTTTASGTTTTTTACPATQVLGADNPQLQNLRDFRDSKLVQSAIGRKVIQIYYNNAESINAALERSPALRAIASKALEAIAPMVGRKE